MNPLNVEVSFFAGSVKNTVPTGRVNLFDMITSPPPELVARVQAVRAEADPSRQDGLKKNVGSITVSGIFKTRSIAGLIKHSGLIALDIDADKNPGMDFEAFKKHTAPTLPWVAACMYSVRGKGLVVYAPIELGEHHGEHFDSLADDFKQLGVTIDPACRDVSRLRIITFDPEPYLNTSATTYAGRKQRAPITAPRPLRPTTKTKAYPEDVFSFARACVERKGIKFGEGTQHTYIHELACILNRYGVPQHEAEAKIAASLLPLSQITTNCITGPYTKNANEHGTKQFRQAAARRPGLHFPRRTTTAEGPTLPTSQQLPDLSWISPPTFPSEATTVTQAEAVADSLTTTDIPTQHTPKQVSVEALDLAVQFTSDTGSELPDDGPKSPVPDWQERVTKLKTVFEGYVYEGPDIALSPYVTVTDVPTFIDRYMKTITQCPQIKTYECYLLRMEQVARHIAGVPL
jgi:hypothetical protein